ncbi:MAG TPA: chromosomal replication initiator protein DnaA [Candidatus Avibacteroides faecavium]|nr:chromosomal replication initiator protein DnaA [Candidatus Avibacteroides faecavium]
MTGLDHIGIWERCLPIIKDNIPPEQYDTWISPIVPVECKDGAFVIRIPSTGFYEIIDQRFAKLIRLALYRVTGEKILLKYALANPGSSTSMSWDSDNAADLGKYPSTDKGNKAPSPADVEVPQDLDPHLNPKLTFDNFVVGESNRLCSAAGLSVACDSATAFNPLFIYGGSGLGKTHLVNAIGTKIKELFPSKKVLYISAHLFRVQFTDATRANTVNDFINFYQMLDVLIIDDVQEFANWKGTQNTFFHIFNYLLQAGKQIIMTCDKDPSELCGMEERILTRFKSGLIAEIERPNFELRKSILQSKINRDGLDFPGEVIDYIALNVEGSVRELEGYIVSLMARSILLNKEIDIDLASHIIKKNAQAAKRALTIEGIVETICTYFNLDKQQLYAKGRKREYAQARQIAMYLSKKYINIPLSRIGQQIAGKDHSTVIYSCHKVQDLMAVDKAFKSDVLAIEEMLHKAQA